MADNADYRELVIQPFAFMRAYAFSSVEKVPRRTDVSARRMRLYG